AWQSCLKPWVEQADLSFLRLLLRAWHDCRFGWSTGFCVQMRRRIVTLQERFQLAFYFQKWLLELACHPGLLSWLRLAQRMILRDVDTKPAVLTRLADLPKLDLSSPQLPSADQTQIPALPAEDVTDGEEQPEEEQLPAVYQPMVAFAATPKQGRSTSSSRSLSKSEDAQKEDLHFPPAAHQRPAERQSLELCSSTRAMSPAEDLRRRLYLKQAPLLRRVFHRWWDMCLAGQLRLVELGAPTPQVDRPRTISSLMRTDRAACL
ncbi:unnamed protein product, partial [Symbiodinium pilosum]